MGMVRAKLKNYLYLTYFEKIYKKYFKEIFRNFYEIMENL